MVSTALMNRPFVFCAAGLFISCIYREGTFAVSGDESVKKQELTQLQHSTRMSDMRFGVPVWRGSIAITCVTGFGRRRTRRGGGKARETESSASSPIRREKI